MRVRLSGVAVAFVALAAVGCNERTQTLPAGPRMLTTTPVSSTACDFVAINQLVQSYFSSAEARVVRDLVRQMQDAGAGSDTAQNRGFDVMVHIASNVDANNPDFADASSLTNALLACMFTSGAELPANFPEDFTVATNPTSHGAYAVRGGTTDPLKDSVLSRPYSAPFSGIAPPGGNTWPGILSSNPPPKRILIYGRPGSESRTYDWKIVPRNTVFSPPAVVGVCVDAGSNNTSLLHEEHVGLLPFVDVTFLHLDTCSPTASASSWSIRVARSVMQWGASLFGPRVLRATAAVNPGGLGGSSGGIGSEFGPQRVETVALSFVQQPKDVRVNQVIDTVRVLATVLSTGEPVPNVSVTLVAVNNNGTPAFLGGKVTQVTNGAGIATFANLTESKTGGYVLVASGTVNGREAIVVLQTTSARFNVRP